MLLKGCQKKMIHLKSTGSDMFEEAYFILNEHYNEKASIVSESDMVREAGRIINDCINRPIENTQTKKNYKNIFMIWYIAGAGSCAFILALCNFIGRVLH